MKRSLIGKALQIFSFFFQTQKNPVSVVIFSDKNSYVKQANDPTKASWSISEKNASKKAPEIETPVLVIFDQLVEPKWAVLYKKTKRCNVK